ncbi:hypothetical protein ACP70R_004842 [Stipagrostis hirtigluma subsp. patula]
MVTKEVAEPELKRSKGGMVTKEGVEPESKILVMATEEGAESKITLVSSDGHEFEVAEHVAMVSPTIKRMIEDDLSNRRVLLPTIASKILLKAVDFAEDLFKSRVAAAALEKDKWAKELAQMDPTSITCLILAAEHLGIDELLDLACRRAAEVMAGRTAEEVQRMFSLKCEVTSEEEAEIRKKYGWAFK